MSVMEEKVAQISGGYYPGFLTVYVCVYCNRNVRLADPEGMCDKYLNVVHKDCLMKVWRANVKPEVTP